MDATMPAKTLAESGCGTPGTRCRTAVISSDLLPIAGPAVDVDATNGLVDIAIMLQYQQQMTDLTNQVG